ncbi:sensor histidine kinase [Enterococcus sp.]|uniref:sensor histidine kinase n=1 Tax=Enterococcus sp. TaxID=35783 RepID=UPI002FC5FF42
MKREKNLMYRLLKIFSIAMMLMISLFSLLVSFNLAMENNKNARLLSKESVNVSTDFLKESLAKQNSLVRGIQQMESRYNSLSLYFSMNVADYFEYTLNNDFYHSNLSKVLSEVYYEENQITAMAIDYLSSKEMYVSGLNRKLGEKVAQQPTVSGIRLHQSLKDPATSNFMGTFYLTLEKEGLDQQISRLFGKYDSQVLILSDTNDVIYTNTSHSRLVKALGFDEKDIQKKYFFSMDEQSGYRVYAFVDRSLVLKNTLYWALFFFSISLFVNGLLLLLLVKLFKGYLYQINDILKVIKEVSKGKINHRITTEGKEAELEEISLGINEMLEGMNHYIKQSYELDIKQKEAEFRALQAQINPHFMYNTLEYIRMYAYSEGMKELAKVVYSFASILRNNISEDKMISLKREMIFIEQYVYLYQTRYPKNIAYSFHLADEVADIQIPKFCLQPLVENYFTHGIDFSRMDNAISVVALLEGNRLIIKIKDNGKGMTESQLQELNHHLNAAKFPESESVGIKNVDERLKLIFGDSYKMSFESNELAGISVVISIVI